MSRSTVLYKLSVKPSLTRRVWAIPGNVVKPAEESSEQRKGVWNHAKRTFKQFAQNTSCHGVLGVADETESRWIRVMWFFVLCLSLVLTSLATYQSTMKNFVNPTFSTELVPKNFSVGELPSIPICDSSIFNTTALEGYGIDKELASYLIISISKEAMNPAFERNITRVQGLKTKLDGILRKHSLSMRALTDEIILKCQDMVVSCISKSIRYSSPECCTRFFGDTFASLAGSCTSTYNAAEKLVQLTDFPHFGFVVYLKSNTRRVDYDHSILYPILTSRRGFFYSASDKIVHPYVWMLSHGNLASTGHWVSVALTKSETDVHEILDSYIVRGTCATRCGKEYKHLVPFYKDYSLKNCWTSQVFFYDRELLRRNCTPLGTPGPADCVDDCVSETYAINPSSMALDIETYDAFDLVLHFYYDSFSYMATVRHYPSAVTWIGEVGGNMGLFLGSSIMTIFEILVFFYHCCRIKPA